MLFIEALKFISDIELNYGDTLINKEDLQTGIDIQKKKWSYNW